MMPNVNLTIISVDSFPVYGNKSYLQVQVDNSAYRIVGKEIADYLDDIFLKLVKIYFL